MDVIDLIISLIDPEAINSLKWEFKGPAFLIIGLFLIRAVKSFFSFSPLKLVTSLCIALILLIILSNAGQVLQQMFLPPDGPIPAEPVAAQSDQHAHRVFNI